MTRWRARDQPHTCSDTSRPREIRIYAHTYTQVPVLPCMGVLCACAHVCERERERTYARGTAICCTARRRKRRTRPIARGSEKMQRPRHARGEPGSRDYGRPPRVRFNRSPIWADESRADGCHAAQLGDPCQRGESAGPYHSSPLANPWISLFQWHFSHFADTQTIRFSSFQQVDFLLRKRQTENDICDGANDRLSFELFNRKMIYIVRQRWCRSNFIRHCPAVNGVHAKRAVCPMQFRNEIIDFFKNCHLSLSPSLSLARSLSCARVRPSFVSSSVSIARYVSVLLETPQPRRIYTSRTRAVSRIIEYAILPCAISYGRWSCTRS
ncbi:uncharacterized protein LOC116851788 [Odontomachus brunneus]|uniref:uncharacterized protein LOC116851788 n=1 Tax=Odontomachus brunneus TaxID=486640 RepID=UPI0013F2812C|nr:uncharacterized protein LOC116851788 [Odontomachus brunneus]